MASLSEVLILCTKKYSTKAGRILRSVKTVLVVGVFGNGVLNLILICFKFLSFKTNRVHPLASLSTNAFCIRKCGIQLAVQAMNYLKLIQGKECKLRVWN